MNIDTQYKNKYENKKRKINEQKTERINLRTTKATKYFFIKQAKEYGFSQSNLFEYIVNNNSPKFVLNAGKIAQELATANEIINSTENNQDI